MELTAFNSIDLPPLPLFLDPMPQDAYVYAQSFSKFFKVSHILGIHVLALCYIDACSTFLVALSFKEGLVALPASGLCKWHVCLQ
jgi:hypothetical protein